MLVSFYYLFFMLFFAFSMFGWGSLILHGNRPSKNISLTIIIGMGITLFVGGILNVLHAAYSWTLNIFLTLGILLALFSLRHVPSHLKTICTNLKTHRSALLFTSLVLFALFIAASNAVMIPEAYNFHDDYQKYFVHPIKMVATGSAFGSPLSSIGKDVFGGQALFQAFFISNLGLGAINAFDSTFCFLLCAALLLEQGAKRGIKLFSIICVLLLTLIHPQYVNISSLYSGALFMLAIIFLSCDVIANNEVNGKYTLQFSVSIGVLYASLIALKTTNGLFPVIHFILYISIFAFLTRNLKLVWSIASIFSASAIFFILPWMFTIFENMPYIRTDLTNSITESLGVKLISPDLFLSTKELFYGGSPIQYSMIVILCLATGISSVVLYKLKETSSIRNASVVAAVSGALTLFLIYAGILSVLQPQIHNFGTSIRYAIPFLLGISPAVLMLTYQAFKISEKKLFTQLLSILSALAAIQFTPQAIARIHQAHECGSTLAFSKLACNRNYRAYNMAVLHGARSQIPEQTPEVDKVSRWQSHVPEGEALIAWINAPFYLDFTRNKIFEVDISGLDNPWAYLPRASYVMWEYNGFATRSLRQLNSEAINAPLYDRRIAEKTLDFINYLNKVDKELVYVDLNTKIYKISQ